MKPRVRSNHVAGAGALLGALGAGLSASGGAASWISVLPAWAVWLGGAAICALTVAAQLWEKR